ncbi:MAG: UDP-N-acetylmuramate--L-alanine ligase, partial [Acidobacteriales bacterium]|nr:UDP-N-acetylmuramate--L-alanine ligase [Terriglobales bacterium]
DCYRDMRDVRRTFLEFMERIPFYGMIVGCNDDPILKRLLPRVHRRVTTYGTKQGSDFLIRIAGTGSAQGEHRPVSRFRVAYKDKDLGEFTLRVPGVHNVLNATAAIAVGTALDVPADQIRAALDNFRGVDRRFQFCGVAAGVSVIDDYGHHPTEIRATLAAARQCGFQRVHVVFQPHRYTRTRDLMDDFTTAFVDADSLFLLDIYAASEKPIEGVTAEVLARRIAEKGNRSAVHVPSFADAASAAAAQAQPGDMILTLGAGNVSQLGPMILEKLKTSR